MISVYTENRKKSLQKIRRSRVKMDLVFVNLLQDKNTKKTLITKNFDVDIQNLYSIMSNDSISYFILSDKDLYKTIPKLDSIFGTENRFHTIICTLNDTQNNITAVKENHFYIVAYQKGNIKLETYELEKKRVYQHNNEYYIIGSGITTRKGGGRLINRKNLGYTFYYNPTTEDIIPKEDYNKDSITETITEEELYDTDNDLLDRGYIPIRPPKVQGYLGTWTWGLSKALEEKDKLLISNKYTKSLNKYTVRKKEKVLKKDVIVEGNNHYTYKKKIKPISSLVPTTKEKGIETVREILEEEVESKLIIPIEVINYLKDLVVYPIETENLNILDFYGTVDLISLLSNSKTDLTILSESETINIKILKKTNKKVVYY